MIQFCGPKAPRSLSRGCKKRVKVGTSSQFVVSGLWRSKQPTAGSTPTEKVRLIQLLHDLVLRKTAALLCAFHYIASDVHVFDEGETEGASTVLVACKFG